jgi:hypothetical protein
VHGYHSVIHSLGSDGSGLRALKGQSPKGLGSAIRKVLGEVGDEELRLFGPK